MKKQRIFYATGGTFNAKSHRGDMSYFGRNIVTVRQGVNDKETVRIRIGIPGPSMNDRFVVYAHSIGAEPNGSKAGTHNDRVYINGEWKQMAYTRGNSSKDSVLYYKTKADAERALAKLQDFWALCKKVAVEPETTVTDASYASAGGKVIASPSGNLTYIIPYDAKAAAAAVQAQTEQATAQQLQADADIATEEATRKTAMGKTLRIAGLAAIAALVIGAVVFIVMKTKKK